MFRSDVLKRKIRSCVLKRGVRLESPAMSYIATPDGLLWTKGVFSVCVAFQRDFSVTWAWLQFGLFGALCIMGLNW